MRIQRKLVNVPKPVGVLLITTLAFTTRGFAAGILVDDFSVPQTGISTGQTAAYDSLINPLILGSRRTLWGGGGSYPGNCATRECMTKVAGGLMLVTPGLDCGGTGTVTWSGIAPNGETIFANMLNLKVTEYLGLEIEIAQIVGSITTRFTISSGGYMGHLFERQVSYFDVIFNSPGKHLFRFSDMNGRPGLVNLMDLDHITMSAYAEVGEFIAFDAVRIIPEPTGIHSVLTLFGFAVLRRGRRWRLGATPPRST